ncbi:hypothetical protein Hanom_Chr10g00919551 [Helianthus anomalus]
MWTRLPPYPTLTPTVSPSFPFSYNSFNTIIYNECNPYTHVMKKNKSEMKENKLSMGSLQRDTCGRRRNYSGICSSQAVSVTIRAIIRCIRLINYFLHLLVLIFLDRLYIPCSFLESLS